MACKKILPPRTCLLLPAGAHSSPWALSYAVSLAPARRIPSAHSWRSAFMPLSAPMAPGVSPWPCSRPCGRGSPSGRRDAHAPSPWRSAPNSPWRTRTSVSCLLVHARRPRWSIYQLHATCVGIRSSLSCSTVQVSNSSTSFASSKNPESLNKATNPMWCNICQELDRMSKLRTVVALVVIKSIRSWWANLLFQLIELDSYIATMIFIVVSIGTLSEDF
jgi:hypothetical protein